MNVPGLGDVEQDPDVDEWLQSGPIFLAALGKTGRIVLDAYEGDDNPEDFHVAIANFLGLTERALKEAEPYIFRYYLKCREYYSPADPEYLHIPTANDVWRHVQLADDAFFSRRSRYDRGVYVCLECGCDWEREHGLQIVFRNGLRVNKVGQFDGHLTNSDAFDDDRYEDVIFVDE